MKNKAAPLYKRYDTAVSCHKVIMILVLTDVLGLVESEWLGNTARHDGVEPL